jgi:hypothetical protein
MDTLTLDDVFRAARDGIGLFVDFKVAETEADVRRAQMRADMAMAESLSRQTTGTQANPWGQPNAARTAAMPEWAVPAALLGALAIGAFVVLKP